MLFKSNKSPREFNRLNFCLDIAIAEAVTEFNRRLKSEKITDSNNGNRVIGYNYDLVGNRLSRTDSVEGLTTYIYDRNNRLTQESQGNKDFGQLAGAGVGMIIGGASPDKLAFNMGRDQWIATTYEAANTAVGAWQTGSHIRDGKLEWSDAFNLAPLVLYPMSTQGVKRFLGGAMEGNSIKIHWHQRILL
jgi:YD repeat-containing protein